MSRTINCCSTFSNEADSQANLELADTALASSPACSRDAPTPLSEAGITDRKLCIAGFRGVLGIQAVVLIPASANETLSYPRSPISILKLLVHQFLYVECLACMYVCVSYVYLVPTDDRRGRHILWDCRYKLQMTELSLGAGDWTQIPWQCSQCSCCLRYLSSPYQYFNPA